MLQLGFIGCGGISSAHLDGLVELRKKGRERFALHAVCDPNPTRSVALADRARRELGQMPLVFSDYRALLASPGLYAVSVMVPHHLHHIVASDAFSAGVHVQMQKPIAISPRFARQMMQEAAHHSRVLTVSEPSVLGAGARTLVRAVQDGLIGRPYLAIDVATAVTTSSTRGHGTMCCRWPNACTWAW